MYRPIPKPALTLRSITHTLVPDAPRGTVSDSNPGHEPTPPYLWCPQCGRTTACEPDFVTHRSAPDWEVCCGSMMALVLPRPSPPPGPAPPPA